MIDPGWFLNSSTWLLVGAVCFLLEIVARWLLFLGFGIGAGAIAVVLWQFSEQIDAIGDPVVLTILVFVVAGLVLCGVLRLIFRRRSPQAVSNRSIGANHD